LHLEEPLTTESVARHVGVSVDRFGRQFKMSTGMTLKEYLNRARVERVKQLLTNPGARISESALAAGFRELGHFNHIFKRYTGQTPREFRSKAIPNSDK
jgi:AraC-like DNA-binding protein